MRGPLLNLAAGGVLFRATRSWAASTRGADVLTLPARQRLPSIYATPCCETSSTRLARASTSIRRPTTAVARFRTPAGTTSTRSRRGPDCPGIDPRRPTTHRAGFGDRIIGASYNSCAHLAAHNFLFDQRLNRHPPRARLRSDSPRDWPGPPFFPSAATRRSVRDPGPGLDADHLRYQTGFRTGAAPGQGGGELRHPASTCRRCA